MMVMPQPTQEPLGSTWKVLIAVRFQVNTCGGGIHYVNGLVCHCMC